MGTLLIILAAVLLAVSLILVFLVLSQDVKGGGLAGALSGGSVQTAFGGRSAESVAKLTAWLAGAFFVIILLMNVFKVEKDLGTRDNPVPSLTTPATVTSVDNAAESSTGSDNAVKPGN